MTTTYQLINSVKISNTDPYSNFNNSIDTTGRVNEKLSTKFNKNDIISLNSTIPEERDNKVYSAAKIDELIVPIDLSNYVKKQESDTVYLTNKNNSLIVDGKININSFGENANYATNTNMDPIEITNMVYYKDYLFLVNNHTSEPALTKLYKLQLSEDKLSYEIIKTIDLTTTNSLNLLAYIYNDKLFVVYQTLTPSVVESHIEIIYDIINDIIYKPKEDEFQITDSIFNFIVISSKLYAFTSINFETPLKLINVNYEKIYEEDEFKYYFSINETDYLKDNGKISYSEIIHEYKCNLVHLNNYIFTVSNNGLIVYKIDLTKTTNKITNEYEDFTKTYYCLTLCNNYIYAIAKESNQYKLVIIDINKFDPIYGTGIETKNLDNISFSNMYSNCILYSNSNDLLYAIELYNSKIFTIELNNNYNVLSYDITNNATILSSVIKVRDLYLYLNNKQICSYTHSMSNLYFSPIKSNFYNNIQITNNTASVQSTPVNDKDIVNKEFVDNNFVHKEEPETVKLTNTETSLIVNGKIELIEPTLRQLIYDSNETLFDPPLLIKDERSLFY